MQSLSISQWIIIAILIVLVAGASSLFTRALGNRRPKERSVQKRNTEDRSNIAPVSRNTEPAAGEHVGLKGWLLLLGILIFALPIFTGAQLWNTEASLQPGIKQQFPATV